jgi:hypothetical protein
MPKGALIPLWGGVAGVLCLTGWFPSRHDGGNAVAI